MPIVMMPICQKYLQYDCTQQMSMSSHFREYHHLACKPQQVAGTFSTGCRNDLPLAEEHLPGGTGGVHYAHGFAGSDKDCSSFFSQESNCGVV